MVTKIAIIFLTLFVINPNAFAKDNKQQLIERICKIKRLTNKQCKTFYAILKHESRLDVSAVNYKTDDHGIGQVNRKTAKAHGFDIKRLTTDFEYSVMAAADVYKWFIKVYGEEQWCRYNVGTGKLTGKRLERCNKYMQRVVNGL